MQRDIYRKLFIYNQAFLKSYLILNAKKTEDHIRVLGQEILP